MTSALFLAPWRGAQSQSVRRYLNIIKLHGNLERRADKHFISALRSTLLWFDLWMSDCSMEFLITRAFCWDCIASIVSIPSSSTHLCNPHCRPITFFCYVSSSDIRRSTHGCPGARGVKMWRADKRASVDRHLLCLVGGLEGCHALRVNWSYGKHGVNLSWWYCVGGM